MAAASSLKSLHQPLLRRRYHSHVPQLSSIFLQTQFPVKLRHYKPLFSSHTPLTTAFVSSSLTAPATTSSSSNEDTCSLIKLASFLIAGDYRRADEETRRLLIVFAGEGAQKRGYVFFSEVQFISADDLRAVDALWVQHSGGKFGYSVQRRLWEKSLRDFTRFFIRVGWMKKLDTEIEQYNYRAFPDEFKWELDASTPEGHLPLTNALRGTQLLQCILTHPAFEESLKEDEDDQSESKEEEKKEEEISKEGKERFRLLKSFKPDYSF
jgi:hypothetical protein